MFILITVICILNLIANIYLIIKKHKISYIEQKTGIVKQGIMTPSGLIEVKSKRDPTYNSDEKMYELEINKQI